MKQKNIYSVCGSIFFGHKFFVADDAKEAVKMYNSLVEARNKSFKENNAFAKENNAIFKGIVYTND